MQYILAKGFIAVDGCSLTVSMFGYAHAAGRSPITQRDLKGVCAARDRQLCARQPTLLQSIWCASSFRPRPCARFEAVFMLNS